MKGYAARRPFGTARSPVEAIAAADVEPALVASGYALPQMAADAASDLHAFIRDAATRPLWGEDVLTNVRAQFPSVVLQSLDGLLYAGEMFVRFEAIQTLAELAFPSEILALRKAFSRYKRKDPFCVYRALDAVATLGETEESVKGMTRFLMADPHYLIRWSVFGYWVNVFDVSRLEWGRDGPRRPDWSRWDAYLEFWIACLDELAEDRVPAIREEALYNRRWTLPVQLVRASEKRDPKRYVKPRWGRFGAKFEPPPRLTFRQLEGSHSNVCDAGFVQKMKGVAQRDYTLRQLETYAYARAPGVVEEPSSDP